MSSVSPELPHIYEPAGKMTASKSLNIQFCIAACHFIQSSYSQISILNSRPSDKSSLPHTLDPSCLNPPLISANDR